MKCPMKFGAEAGKDACAGEECMWYVDAYGIKGCAVALNMAPRKFIVGLDDAPVVFVREDGEGGGE